MMGVMPIFLTYGTSWLVHNALLWVAVVFSLVRGGVFTSAFGACRRDFRLSNSGHILVGCPTTSHKLHSGGTLEVEAFEASTFFPFFLTLFLAPIGVDAGIAC